MLHNKRPDYYFLILNVFSILFMISLLTAGHVEAAVELGKFTRVEGKVDVLNNGELPAIPAHAGDKVFLKNVIRTKSNSKAEILFSDGNILKIDQRSRVDISEYVTEDGKGKRIIKLPRGKVEATVMPKLAQQIETSSKAHSFEIHTPNAIAGVRGTQYRVLHIGNITWVFVFEGSVNVYNPKFPDAVQVVNAGFMIMIPSNQPAQPPRPLDPALLGLNLEGLPPGTGTGTTQNDIVVIESVEPDITPPYIPPTDDPAPSDTKISFSGIVDTYLHGPGGAAFRYYAEPWPFDGGLFGTGWMLGSLSGSTDSWANPILYTASGTYYMPFNIPDALFAVPFQGSASDNTAFIGGLGGRGLNGQIDGRSVGMYIKPDHTAGILFSSDMTGTYGVDTWQTSGTLNAVDMGTTTYSPSDLYWGGSAYGEGNWRNGSVKNIWDDNVLGTAFMNVTGIIDQGWGLLWGEMGNTYTVTPPQAWDMEVSFNEYASGEGPLILTALLNVQGSEWANNKLSGKFTGYWANIKPITGIMVGETLGTYDPAAKTWQALNMGYLLETNTFLSMVQTAAGQAALQKLNIPSVEVGRTNLTGSYSGAFNDLSISLNNVVFFASSTGSAPSIWATGNLFGNYTGNLQGVSVPLSGNGLNANFYVDNWDVLTNRWLSTINGGGTLGGGSYSGPVSFRGAGAGTFTGTTTGTLSGTAAGIASSALFVPMVSFSGIIDSCLGTGSNCNAFWYYASPWPDWGGLWETGDILGSFSGSTDSWANPAPFTASGTYNNTEPRAILFGVPFEGSASDNTAFMGGILGRVPPPDQLDGRVLGLYIKPDHTAGILFSSDMTGTHSSGDTGTWQSSGTLNAVDMGTTIYSPADLKWGSPAVDEGEWSNGSVLNVWDNVSGTARQNNFRIIDQFWGFIVGDMGNTYTVTPPQNWEMEVRFDEYVPCIDCNAPLIRTALLAVQGSEWANNKLSGKFTGYWADINSTDGPLTGIMVGETLGTFDPSTWQAMNIGYIIETNKFLSMVQTVAGQAALQKLNIPSVEIGRANLSGSYANGSTLTINMNDVIFFASSTGATAPSIWATNNVNGTYSGNPQGVTVPLSGNGLQGTFNVANWDTSTNKWLATINDGGGGGVYSGTGSMNGSNIKINGAGAGTFTGTTSGTLSGTAAGLAKINVVP